MESFLGLRPLRKVRSIIDLASVKSIKALAVELSGESCREKVSIENSLAMKFATGHDLHY